MLILIHLEGGALKSFLPANNDSLLKFFRIEERDDSRFLILCALFLVLALLIWMSFAQIAQVVRVEGRIIPAGKAQQVQHLEGGIISVIRTQEGAVVHKGDILLEVDGTMAGASLSETKVKLEAQFAHAARLKAEVEGTETILFPGEVTSKSVIEAEENLFSARKLNLQHEISVNQSLLSQRIAELQEAKIRKERLSSEIATAVERMSIVNNMSANGAASKMEVLDAKGREQSLRTEISSLEGMIPKLDASVSEAKSKIEETQSNFRAQAQSEYVETLSEIDRLKQEATAADDRMKRTDVRAPVDGVINALYVNTVGGVIKPGEVLLEITPTTGNILIESRAMPKDRGFLHSGLNTEIRVSAYDTAEFGMIKGTVTKVSADSLKDSDNHDYYQVDIAVYNLPDRYQGKEIVPGMTVTADIVTGKRTILNYLLSPIRKFTYNIFRDAR